MHESTLVLFYMKKHFFPTEAAPNLIKVDFPLFTTSIYPFVNKKSKIQTLEDLRGKRYTSLRGFFINNILVENYQLKLKELDSLPSVYQFVNSGRADVFFGLWNTKKIGFNNDEYPNIIKLPHKAYTYTSYMWVHKSKKHLIQPLQETFSELIKENKD